MILLMLNIVGCSHKAIYDTLRLDERNQCIKTPPFSYSKCIERTGKPYEVYKRERKEIIRFRDTQTD